MSSEDMNANMATNENENNVAEANNELNELRESNENLIAEREALMKRVKELEEKPLTPWEKFRLGAFWWLLGASVVGGVVIFRKPLFALVRRFI